MADGNEQFKQVFSELANALQTAALLASRQRSELEDLAQDAVHLEAAIERAVRAVGLLREGATLLASGSAAGRSDATN